MSKVTDVEARLGVTVNIGNFESVRLDYSVRCQLEEGDTPAGVLANAREWLKGKVTDDLRDSNGGKDLLKKP